MIKQLLIIDKKIDYLDEIQEGLNLVSEDLNSIGLKIENSFEKMDMSNIEWQESNYDKNYYIATPKWIRYNSGDKGDYDVVTFVIDDYNWSVKGLNRNVWGWSAGKYGKYRILLVRAKKGRKSNSILYGKKISVYFSLLEELFHTLPRFIKERTGVDLDKKYGFNVSEQIIHGKNPSYTRWKYIKFLKENKTLLLRAFNDMRYVIVQNRNQFVLIESIKIALSIADTKELENLKKRGLSGEPEYLNALPKGYEKYPLVSYGRIKDVFNL